MSKVNILLKKLHLIHNKELTFKDKFLLAVAGLGIILLIVFILYLTWFASSQKSIAHFLPDDKTVAYIEFKDFVLPAKLENNKSLFQEKFEQVFKKLFNADFKFAVKWANGRFGMVLIENIDGKSTPVIFMQTGSRRETLNFFKQFALPEEELTKSGTIRLPIYSYPQSQSFNFAFIGPYTFIADSISPIKMIQETYSGERPALINQKDYQKSLSNLPRQDWVRGYINFQSLNFKDDIAIKNIIEPLKNVINHIAFTVRKNLDGFHFNTFVNLAPELLSLKENNRDKTRFAYKLTDDISAKDLALYIGGANLSQEWQNTLDTIANLNPAYGIILEGIIRAQISKVFGDNVDLRNDFYPLFEGEYALAIGKSEEKNRLNISLILSNSDQEFAKTKLAKMMDGFKYLAAQFAPKLREVVLPDGTISRELVADTSKLQETSETYEGYEVHCVEVVNTSSGFCYTVTDELIVIANNRDTATGTIDLTLSPKYMLSQHQPFRQTISNLSKVSDEITFIDIQKFMSLIADKPLGILIEPFLKEFNAVSWVKHYFDDGMSTEGYILIK
jgi:hypothetical protein